MPRRSQTRLSGRFSASEHEAHSLPLRGESASPIWRILLGCLLHDTLPDLLVADSLEHLGQLCYRPTVPQQRLIIGNQAASLDWAYIDYFSLEVSSQGQQSGTADMPRHVEELSANRFPCLYQFADCGWKRTRAQDNLDDHDSQLTRWIICHWTDEVTLHQE